MMPKKKELPKVGRWGRCARAISWQTCRWDSLPGSRVGGGGGGGGGGRAPPETHLDFLPTGAVWTCLLQRWSGASGRWGWTSAHLQLFILRVGGWRDEQVRISEEGFVYHDPQREGGSGFSDTLLPAAQTSGKSVSDKIRFQKRTSLLVRNKRASS